MNNISLDEAWVAGIFEGEGTIVIRDRRKEGCRNGRSVALSVVSTDEDIIYRIHNIMNVGTTGGPYIRKSYGIVNDKWKPSWHWRVNHARDVVTVLEKFMPYFGKRRKAKAQEAIKYLKERGIDYIPKPACLNGHLFNETNTRYNKAKNGKITRTCRKCHNRRAHESKRRMLELSVSL
jgi:hypothetical protein